MIIQKHKEKRSPKLGDIRWVKRFALFPKRINDEELIWFCWYSKKQHLDEVKIDTFDGVFSGIQWVDIENEEGYCIIEFER